VKNFPLGRLGGTGPPPFTVLPWIISLREVEIFSGLVHRPSSGPGAFVEPGRNEEVFVVFL